MGVKPHGDLFTLSNIGFEVVLFVLAMIILAVVGIMLISLLRAIWKKL